MAALNPQQRAAVRYVDGPLLVLAGAGSGKTRVITEKIAWLVQACGYAPERLAAVTFTNKAAREMRERVARLLPRHRTAGLRISTFHRLGLEILRAECQRLGLGANFTLLDGEDVAALLRELAESAGGISAGLARERISRWKNDRIDPAAAGAAARDEGEARLAALYARYREALAAYNAVDLDDLILLPAQLFAADPEALARWRGRIRYLLVDEYQDTNLAQYQLVRLLVGDRGGLTAVGDDAQSIYAWRGARPENLARLRRDFPDLKVIVLEQNYRSTGRILAAANHLIRQDPTASPKRLWSELGPGDPVRVIRTADERAEADRVATEIASLRLERRARYGDIAILYRGNHQARPLEFALRSRGIPYRVHGAASFFERTEVRDLLAYLRLLANPADDAAFLRVVNVPRRQIGHATLLALAAYARRRGLSLLAACGELGLRESLPAGAAERLERFRNLLSTLTQRLTQEGPSALDALPELIGYDQWTRREAPSPEAAARRLANVALLLSQVGELLATGEPLAGALARLAVSDLLERADEDGGDRVQLMTLHAAKGLEFPHVFLVGFEEELLPHRESIAAGDVGEERRLAYVGITRAQRTLTLTLAERRQAGRAALPRAPSRFLADLPEEALERIGFDGGAPQRTRAAGERSLAALRALLDEGDG